MAAEITHRSVLISAQRYGKLRPGGRAPHPAWVALHLDGFGWAALAANCQAPHEVQELVCEEREGGDTPFMKREAKLELPERTRVPSALCVLSSTDVAVGDDAGAVHLFRYHPSLHQYVHAACLCTAAAPHAVRHLAAHSRTLAFASDRAAYAHDESSAETRTLLRHAADKPRLTALAIGAGGVAIGDASGTVAVHSRAPGAGAANKSTKRKALRYGAVRALCWRGARLLAAGDDESIHILAPKDKKHTLRERSDPDGHSSFVCGVAVRAGRILSAGLDGRLVLWSDADHALGTVVLERPGESFWGLQWPADHIAFLAASTENGRSLLYRIRLHLPPPPVATNDSSINR